MLLINDVPLHCINQAAVSDHIPAAVIISVLRTENGRAGEANCNENGSYDYGPMQINSDWLPMLHRYGYTRQEVQNNACINVSIGAWILAMAISGGSNLWNGVGDYHSHTPYQNFQYQYKVRATYSALVTQLNRG